MTREEILRATQSNFEEYFAVWEKNMDHKGLGALVFSCREDFPFEGQYQCDYLTLSELRASLSGICENADLVYRWVRQAETVRGMPVVIIPHPLADRRKVALSGAPGR